MADHDPASRIYLSPPHMSGREATYVMDAFASNWIAPLGPHVDAFESEFCQVVGASAACAVSSGTAALHLALQLTGVSPGDEVFVSTFTFAASVNPIRYLGARPVFIDSESISWNMDPDRLHEALKERRASGVRPAAIVVVHLYGQAANVRAIAALAAEYDVPLIEDAAEALGATCDAGVPGTIGDFGVFSFNGNKIITTSGGGMLVGRDPTLIARARKLASQAREPAPHYEHREVGYNYRLSNVLAAIGRAQLEVLQDRVAARRRVYSRYEAALGSHPGLAFMPEAPWGRSTRWLTALTVDPAVAGASATDVRVALEERNIEARPLWKPMHLQPVFNEYPRFGGVVAEALFDKGICLPSGSDLTDGQLARVIRTVQSCLSQAEQAVP